MAIISMGVMVYAYAQALRHPGAEAPVGLSLICPLASLAAHSTPYTPPSMEALVQSLLDTLALPQFGLSTVLLVSFVSATLLPLGSEPAVFGLIKLNPELFWPAILVATLGNTLGGMLNWWMGRGAQRAWHAARMRRQQTSAPSAENDLPPLHASRPSRSRHERLARYWLRRFGARACLLSWLPVVGDPLCAVAGWLRLPFWPCVAYMAIGKFMRYWIMTSALLYWVPLEWAR